MSSSHRLVVHGAAGRMGQRIIACAAADTVPWHLVAAIERAGHPKLGTDAGTLAGSGDAGVAISEAWSCPADVVSVRTLIADAAKVIPVLQAPSMSLAVNIAMDLVSRAGTLLKRVGTRADVEIIECHHRHKEDSPSGTALKFGAIVQDAMGQTRAAHGREGRPGARPADEIGYHAVRAGDNPGEHTILFGLDGESLAVNVRATNRDCYAKGALAAAAFLIGKPVGLYSMRDVLGLT
jgi:4-hydroxy-tetrahydrodipicolinate reductase